MSQFGVVSPSGHNDNSKAVFLRAVAEKRCVGPGVLHVQVIL